MKLLFTLVALLIAEEHILCILVKESHRKSSEKSNFTQRTRHVNKKQDHYKAYPTVRNETQRCTIFCPVVIVFPNVNGTLSSLKPVRNATESTTLANKSTTAQVTKKTSGQNRRKIGIRKGNLNTPDPRKKIQKFRQNKAHTRQILKQNKKKITKTLKNGHSLPQEKGFKAISKRKEDKNKALRKYSYHDLNPHQKHLLLKQLNLGNSHGKKAYKFKEISTSLCRVICLEENKVPSNTTSPIPEKPQIPQKVTTTEATGSNEDSYEEGEDTPIEITYKPPQPQRVVIGGIRPFGPVDFNGLSDFGPNGEPARDFTRPG